MLEAQNPSAKGIGFAHRKEFGEEHFSTVGQAPTILQLA
jgi:hypothetical protein